MLGKVDFISITLMWALIDLLNVNRKRKKWTVVWMGDRRITLLISSFQTFDLVFFVYVTRYSNDTNNLFQ